MISPSSLGFGDVKLSGLIGLVLGWLVWVRRSSGCWPGSSLVA